MPRSLPQRFNHCHTSSLHAINKDLGAYATDTFDLTEALSLTASGRYNVADIELRDQRAPISRAIIAMRTSTQAGRHLQTERWCDRLRRCLREYAHAHGERD